MGFRMTFGSRQHGNEHYAEGYNTGYNNAMDEMRRRTRSAYDYDEPEMRRRTRGMHDDEPEMRRRMPMDDTHWPIGFTHDVEDRRGRRTRGESDTDILMDMMHDIKKGQEKLASGLAASAKKLDPHMEALLETATSVLDNPPSTWEPYIERQDFLGIAKMEGKELLRALEEHKPMKDIRKELSHTFASLLQLVSK